jgi:hypothetical protein
MQIKAASSILSLVPSNGIALIATNEVEASLADGIQKKSPSGTAKELSE